MKKLIVLVLLLVITNVCYADLIITIKNTTDKMVIVYIDSIDHGIKFNGRTYPAPTPVCGGEIQPHDEFVLQPRNHNKSPHRYVLTVCRTENMNIVSSVSTIFIIEPGKKEHIIIIGDKDG